MPLPSTRVVHDARTPAVARALDFVKPDRATIKRRVLTKTAGGESESLATIGRDRPCRVRTQGRRSIEVVVGERSTDTARWEVTFENGEDVKVHDRVYVVGRVFDVLEAGVESLEPEVRCLCVEVSS